MTIAFVAGINGAFGSSGGGTTSPVNMINVDFITFAIDTHPPGSGETIADSNSNVYTARTRIERGNVSGQFYDCVAPIVTSSMTFSLTGSGIYPSCRVDGWSGVKQTSPLDQENGSTGTGTTLSTGSVTPSENNELVVSILGHEDSGSVAIDSPMAITGQVANASNQIGCAVAYEIQTTATARNPNWTSIASGSSAAQVATYKAAAAAAQDTPELRGYCSLSAQRQISQLLAH